MAVDAQAEIDELLRERLHLGANALIQLLDVDTHNGIAKERALRF